MHVKAKVVPYQSREKQSNERIVMMRAASCDKTRRTIVMWACEHPWLPGNESQFAQLSKER